MSRQVISYSVNKYKGEIKAAPPVIARVLMIVGFITALFFSIFLVILFPIVDPIIVLLVFVLGIVIMAVVNSSIIASRSRKEGLSKDYIRLPQATFYTFTKNEAKPQNSRFTITSEGNESAIVGWALFGVLGMILFSNGRRPINLRTTLSKIYSVEPLIEPLDRANFRRSNRIIYAISWSEGATVYKLTLKNGLTVLIEPTEELFNELKTISYGNF